MGFTAADLWMRLPPVHKSECKCDILFAASFVTKLELIAALYMRGGGKRGKA